MNLCACSLRFEELIESDTLWQDPITSYALTGNFGITQKVKNVVRIEYVNDLPSIYPMFREPTVIVVDISDSKFDIKKEDGNLYTVDFLIRNAVRALSFEHGFF